MFIRPAARSRSSRYELLVGTPRSEPNTLQPSCSGLQPKGADRKLKTDREKMEKKTVQDREKYQPSHDTTLLKEVRRAAWRDASPLMFIDPVVNSLVTSRSSDQNGLERFALLRPALHHHVNGLLYCLCPAGGPIASQRLLIWWRFNQKEDQR